ncbi:MAG: regulatory protein RecX [Phascolarctobacterium sp.]|nr:regulatory protein RecX [Phascolarctobacterium sp.]
MLNRSLTKKTKLEMQSSAEAYDKALDLLNYHDFSEKAMTDRLKKKGATDEQAKEAVEKLNEYGILNEERYAERVYAAWLSKGSYGKLHLQAELTKRSIKQELISTILEAFTSDLEEEHARKAASIFLNRNKKKIALLGTKDPKIYGAASRFMVARGFSSRYVRILLEELHFDDDM